MKITSFEIKPGVGLGSISFGMTRENFKKIAGEPDEIEKYSFSDKSDDKAETWHYDELEMSVSFEEINNWLLTSIAVSSPDFKLHGKNLIGLSKTNVEKEIAKMKLGKLEIIDISSEESPESELLSIEESSLNFWFENGMLSEIQWGPVMEDEE
ncbi:MAG: hypothetical protein JXJ22_00510 [Bacteroidales bacterium]|nr:hypothetical protein [Bacteroidales bacterium]